MTARRALLPLLGLLLTANAAATGCATEEAGSDAQNATSCEGAALDGQGICRMPNGQFAQSACCVAAVSRSCDVVWVDYGVSELEEGFGAFYDVDEEGYPQADEDATYVDLEIKPGEATVSLGHHSFTSADGDDIRRTDERLEYSDFELESYRIAPAGWSSSYNLRLYNPIGIGLLMKEDPSYQWGPKHLATVDCRGIVRDEPTQPLDTNDLSCNVVWVDYDVSELEEGFGAVYDLGPDGYFMADGDSIDVSIEREATGWSVSIGQYWFQETDGDVVTVAEDPEAGDYGVVTYSVRPDGWSDVFQVNVFPGSGLGAVYVGDAATGPNQQLAVIDCRGLPNPDPDA